MKIINESTIGKQIYSVLKDRKMSIQDFADAIPCARTNVYDIFNRSSIDTELLLRISNILHFSFFEYLEKKRKEQLGNTLGFQTYNSLNTLNYGVRPAVSDSSPQSYKYSTEEEILASYRKYMSQF